MQAFIQHEGMQHPTFPERLTERLPTLSSQAADVLAKRCRRVIRQAIALALRVKLRILTRREAALALYDRFPGLTRQTSDRIIGRSISRLSQ
ncbi:hypothetical protein [Dyella sp. C11]|uniref:hypothetical protein n=1 Tax=Dyella sp. C11 TaxID=2126991 RepID=UPI0013007626|nr:hypothetical protein [Dyella sp. C11]